MRILVLLRGAPGAGKSTFIKEHNLEPYTLSADSIRLTYSSPVLGADGKLCIAQNYDKQVWNHLFEVLEFRMQNGNFTVIDGVNSKTKDMKHYKDLAEKYRYRIYVVDMTDIPKEQCLRQNKLRPTYKQVPDYVIENVYSRFETQTVPSGIKVIKPDEFEDVVFYKSLDLSDYERIYIVGDIHGCAEPFKKFLAEKNCEKSVTIFCGDYIDRGPANDEVLSILYNLKDDKSTILLEGNHEIHLRNYGYGDSIKSPEFVEYTLPQLQRAGFTDKMAREFCRKLSQCVYFTYGNEKYFVCHGGLSSFTTELAFVPARQMIHGTGLYSEYEQCADNLLNPEYNPNGIIQVNGHRNLNKVNTLYNKCSYNLEGQVEFGGKLRVLVLEKEPDTNRVVTRVLYYENTEPVCEHILSDKHKNFERPLDVSVNQDSTVSNHDTIETMQIADIINSLRHNRHITEKKFGNISSFNFTRDAFYKGVWNAQTVKARGLYLDTMQNKVFCRGYEKFFKIGERPETEIPVLSKTLTYPITIYGKENGYLGLISYDYYNDDLFYTTKSDPSGSYAEHLRFMHQELTTEANRATLKEYLKQNNCTLAVEVIDPEFDPHIIEYDTKKIVALELIENVMTFKHKTYAELLVISAKAGLGAKQWCTTCYNWDDFYNFITQKANNSSWIKAAFDRDTIEGYVMEDNSGFMLKLKTDYYDLWKKRRGIAATIIKHGHYNYTGSLQTPEDNYFYAWLMQNWREYHDNPQIPQDIITLRKKFKNYLDKMD